MVWSKNHVCPKRSEHDRRYQIAKTVHFATLHAIEHKGLGTAVPVVAPRRMFLIRPLTSPTLPDPISAVRRYGLDAMTVTT